MQYIRSNCMRCIHIILYVIKQVKKIFFSIMISSMRLPESSIILNRFLQIVPDSYLSTQLRIKLCSLRTALIHPAAVHLISLSIPYKSLRFPGCCKNLYILSPDYILYVHIWRRYLYTSLLNRSIFLYTANSHALYVYYATLSHPDTYYSDLLKA